MQGAVTVSPVMGEGGMDDFSSSLPILSSSLLSFWAPNSLCLDSLHAMTPIQTQWHLLPYLVPFTVRPLLTSSE